MYLCTSYNVFYYVRLAYFTLRLLFQRFCCKNKKKYLYINCNTNQSVVHHCRQLTRFSPFLFFSHCIFSGGIGSCWDVGLDIFRLDVELLSSKT